VSQRSSSKVKETLHRQYARIAAALASPQRSELVDLLCQGERNVLELASATGLGVANTSAHLQVLQRAQLVETRKEGTRVFYRLAGDEVARFYIALRELARMRLPEVALLAHDFFEATDQLEPVTQAELARRLRRKQVTVVDVRPVEECRAGHIRGAISMPLATLRHRMGDLPRDREVVAYCRGPYCVLAPQAVEILRAAGLHARRLADGFPEWRLARLPMVAG
jgi:rhodanese-related sulfurtransferase/DNA-binding transcriptional ArsR family regulator